MYSQEKLNIYNLDFDCNGALYKHYPSSSLSAEFIGSWKIRQEPSNTNDENDSANDVIEDDKLSELFEELILQSLILILTSQKICNSTKNY